jgi:two-component system, OmpR family, phosphate regulon sensor histidine kinase PhoR
MVEGVLVIDGEGTVVLANARAARLLDLPRDTEHVGRSLAELSRHPDLHELVRLVRAEGDWGEPMVQEVSVGTAQTLILQVTASRLPARADMQRWFVLVFHDISSIRRLERVRRDFVANVSHELRTPLTVVSGYLEALLEAPEACAAFEPQLRSMQTQTERMNRIVEDLMLLSRLESEAPEVDAQPVQVGSLLESIVSQARELSGPEQHCIELDVDRDLCIKGREPELYSAFSNLVFNAVRYTPAGGRIEVSWQDSEQGPRFAVQDSGVGIEAHHIPRVTERFYRVDAGRSRSRGGTGLGLAIVKHVLLRHQTVLEIDSEPGVGSTFHCRFAPQRRVGCDHQGA